MPLTMPLTWPTRYPSEPAGSVAAVRRMHRRPDDARSDGVYSDAECGVFDS
jgi:hypothetical protein